jgi:hypothetical protein
MDQHDWQRITPAPRPDVLPGLVEVVCWCRRCGAVMLQLERDGRPHASPDYWRVGGTGEPEFTEPPCRALKEGSAICGRVVGQASQAIGSEDGNECYLLNRRS